MSDFIPVTRTKIIVPRRRSEILSRRRLLDLLDELLDNRLIIVAAPAGYGKTSLLVDFSVSTEWPVCWYSLDNLDQDPYRFIAHFISALAVRFPKFGKSCLAALQSMGQDRLDLDVIASLIINDAYENITEHFIMVLDDFHLIEAGRQVVYFINRFIQDVDENCHLVLASRTLLTLPDLTLMVARSQVGGLSFEELCFQPDEIQNLLRQNYKIDLSDLEAEDMARSTEGWVTGLLLSTQVMEKNANRLRVSKVSGIGLYEYLAQQVLAQQPPEMQDFMLYSSLLDEFDDTLCVEVIGKALGIEAEWRKMMNIILRHNLFVLPVGEEGQYLRYHHLFLDFLRDRVRRDHPVEARLVQMRLAEVYVQREEWERAYQLYQNLGESEAIVRMVENAGSTMIIRGRVLTLNQWLDSMEPELLNRHPSLISLKGAAAVSLGHTSQGLELLSQAAELLTEANQPVALALTLYRRSVTYRIMGHYRDALKDADDALALLVEYRETSVIYVDALISKGLVLFALGQMNEVLSLYQEALAAVEHRGDIHSIAKVWMEIGRFYRSNGQQQEAEEAYLKALEHAQITGNLNWQANLYNNLGVLQHDRNDFASATSSLEKAIQYARISGSARLEAYALTSIGDLYMELDAVQESLEAYRQARLIAQRIHEGYLLLHLNLMEARLLQAEGQLDHAEEMFLAAQSMAKQRGSLLEQNLCRLEEGRLKLSRSQYLEAEVDLTDAMNFFLEEKYQVQIPRARLYVLLVSEILQKSKKAEEQALELRPMLAIEEKLKLLVSAGREISNYLRKLPTSALDGFPAALLAQIDRHEQGIPALRRLIRRQAVIVPFAPPKLTIRSLGKIQVKITDHIVTSSEWQVQTARDLFFLLLAHPEGLTKEEIGEIFWPDSSPSELKLRFKNTIYRLRHAAGKDVIMFQGESLYLFNREMDYEYDAESFIKEIAQAKKASTVEMKISHYDSADKFYRGSFLPEVDESWVIAERERLFQMHIDALLELASLHLQLRDYDAALLYCQKALLEDSCQEDAHRIAMRVYASMGNRALIMRQYEQCRKALMQEINAPPSYQTQTLYKSLIQ